ncbi:MAG: tetratricopeptide repeat protein [Candidatus Obscuribacter sp.]|nr:tetratricopeptide repeat protein [Candidatus Obscuribacter sp.]
MIEKLKLMGDSALSRGLYDEAEGYYQRALDGLGNSSEEPVVAEALRGIARCCLARGDYVKAERSANRAMAIDEDYWGPGCAQVGDSYFIMAEASRYQGALGRAEYFYGSALEYKRFHLGDDHAEVALIYARLCLTSLIHGLSPGLDELIALCHHNFKRVPTARDFVSYLDLREMLVYLLEANRNLEPSSSTNNLSVLLLVSLAQDHLRLSSLSEHTGMPARVELASLLCSIGKPECTIQLAALTTISIASLRL